MLMESTDNRLNNLENKIEMLFTRSQDHASQLKDLRYSLKDMSTPLKKLQLESKAMNAKANNAKKLLKTLQEVNEVNTTDIRGE